MDEVIWQENNWCDLLQHHDNILILVSEVNNMLIFTMTNDAINHKSIMTQGKYIYAFMKKAVDFHIEWWLQLIKGNVMEIQYL